MKTILLFLIPFSLLFSQDDFGVFTPKEMTLNSQHFLMSEDGDIIDEDVATIEDEVSSLMGERYSFGRSKRILATKVYKGHQKAFYSDCNYRIIKKKLKPVHKSCGFHYRKNKKRSQRIEWEHIVPAWHFGHQLHCWQNGGRMNCRQNNEKFKYMEADMHNLVPAIGEINGDRSNFKYSMIPQQQSFYGKVKMKISFKDKHAQPPQSKHGEIARTYFYMRDKYGLKISKAQENLFIKWNNSDPVNSWEKKRNNRIKSFQGDENLYVSNYKQLTPSALDETSSRETTPSKKLPTSLEEWINTLPKPLAIIVLILIALFRFFILKKRR